MTPFHTARDAIFSLFQSAAASIDRAPAAGHVVAVRTSQIPPVASPSRAITCAHLGLELLEALAADDHDQARALQNRLSFSECDPLWAETLIRYAATYLADGRPPPIPYIRHTALTDFVIPAAAPTLRVALLSDWGTGTGEARAVLALLARQSPDVLIHLGDIYYSGTEAECAAHFLAPMREALPATRLFTLCGNHDTYSGGAGYYGLLRQIGQPASYFCLRSPDRSWQILGADTGLNDANPFFETTALTSLDPGEEDWHADKLRGFPGLSILLTHHEPFSSFRQIGPAADRNPQNPHLVASLARLHEAGPVHAWFWGHEHRLRLYAPYAGLRCGRNIGYGAVPVPAAAEAALPNLLDPPQTQVDVTLDAVDGAYTHGFALLDLSAGGAEISYWAVTRPDGPIFREALRPKPDQSQGVAARIV